MSAARGRAVDTNSGVSPSTKGAVIMTTTDRGSETLRNPLRPLCRAALLVAVMLGLGLLPLPAGAQNLLVNGTFDHDTGAWAILFPDPAREIHFVSTQGSTLTGGSGPGSIEVRDLDMSGFNGADILMAYQDVTVQGGGSYWCSAAMFRPTIHNEALRMGVFVEWLDASQSVIDEHWIRPPSYPADTWIRGEASMVAPPSAVTARVLLTVGLPHNPGATDPALIYYDDLVFQDLSTTTATQALFVPAAASAHGYNETFWTTTGWFASQVAVPVDLFAGFLRQGQANGAAVEGVLFVGTVPPYGFLEVDDLAAKIGGAGLTGGIYILAVAEGGGLPSTLITATTYTFTPNPDGGGAFGQGLPAVPAGTRSAVVVPGVFQGVAYRTNIGVLNTSGSQVIITVEIFSPGGQSLGTVQWVLGAYEQKQVPVTALGVSSASGGYVTFSRTSSTGSFRAYATVVDQRSGDAVYTPGL
jgi:hypothetical protein